MIFGESSTRVLLYSLTNIIYGKITSKNGMENLPKYLDTLGGWAVENGIKMNPGKSRTIRFTRVQVRNQVSYCLDDQKIPEASSCKYYGIILRSDLNCVDQVNYKTQKAWKAFLFVVRVKKKLLA